MLPDMMHIVILPSTPPCRSRLLRAVLATQTRVFRGYFGDPYVEETCSSLPRIEGQRGGGAFADVILAANNSSYSSIDISCLQDM